MSTKEIREQTCKLKHDPEYPEEPILIPGSAFICTHVIKGCAWEIECQHDMEIFAMVTINNGKTWHELQIPGVEQFMMAAGSSAFLTIPLQSICCQKIVLAAKLLSSETHPNLMDLESSITFSGLAQ